MQESPFALVFITGNISVCAGCSNHYPKPAARLVDSFQNLPLLQMTCVSSTQNGEDLHLQMALPSPSLLLCTTISILLAYRKTVLLFKQSLIL